MKLFKFMFYINLDLMEKLERKYYWFFQLTFWTIHYLYVLQFNYTFSLSSQIMSIYLILLTFSGIPLSIILSTVYNYKKKKSNRILRELLFILSSCFVAANVWYVIILLLDYWILSFNVPVSEKTFSYYYWEVSTHSLILFVWSLLYQLLVSWKQWNTKQINILKIKELEKKSLETELKYLKNQLNPHFLFNVLNNIYSHSLEKSDKTPEIVLMLSDLLRYVIYETKSNYIPVYKEIDFIRQYINLEITRIEEDIDVTINISCNKNSLVPSLILIPIVENAFKHGLENENKYIYIDVFNTDDNIVFKLVNSKSLKTRNSEKYSGLGLANLEQRLALLYDNNYKLTTLDEANKFTTEIIIPHL